MGLIMIAMAKKREYEVGWIYMKANFVCWRFSMRRK
ncbi:hypothetical protein AKJ16_DCAP17508, partial [Drosera capensis]